MGLVQRRVVFGKGSGGTSPGRRRGPVAEGWFSAMAGWRLTARASRGPVRQDWEDAAIGTTGLGKLSRTVGLGS